MKNFDIESPRIKERLVAGNDLAFSFEPRVFLYRPGSRAISPLEELQQTAELIRNNL